MENLLMGHTYKAKLDFKVNGVITTDRAFANWGIAGNTAPGVVGFSLNGDSDSSSVNVDMSINAPGTGQLTMTSDVIWNKDSNTVTEPFSALMQYSLAVEGDTGELVITVIQLT